MLDVIPRRCDLTCPVPGRTFPRILLAIAEAAACAARLVETFPDISIIGPGKVGTAIGANPVMNRCVEVEAILL